MKTAEEAIVAYAKTKFSVTDIVRAEIYLETNQGFSCCGGRDPECYCSLAEGASSYLQLTAYDSNKKHHTMQIHESFATILEEIIKIGNRK